jgi:TonB family protein
MSWNQNAADERRFRIISAASILLALLLGITLNLVHAPLPERRDEVIPPHLAQIVMERKKEPPPKIEPPKPVEPEKLKPEDIKKESKKVEEKPQPKPVETKPEPVVTEPQPQQPQQPQAEAPRVKNVEAARQKAASSGVLAMKDMLSDLRESAPAETIQKPAQQLQSGGGEASAPSRSVLTAKAGKGSGGIDTSKFSRDTGGSAALAGHETAAVVSRLDTLPAAQGQKKDEQAAQEAGGRSQGEISRTIEANRAAIWSIYQRALRQNPAMQGKVVFKITIAPSGEVTDCIVESSDLGDPDLERKLALRIKRIDFGAKNVETTAITYPINFLPNL